MTVTTAQMKQLVDAILAGDHKKAVAETRQLLGAGVAAEQIVTEGIEVATDFLDEKCTVEEFNLLEIMLAGRAVNMVSQELFPQGRPLGEQKGSVIVAALEGDVHDLGKNILKMVLSGEGYRVIDMGVDCSLESLTQAVEKEAPLAVYISGLITSVIFQVQQLRDALAARGLSQVRIAAGGAALKQATADDLNVDFVAQSAFEGSRYLGEIAKERQVQPERRVRS